MNTSDEPTCIYCGDWFECRDHVVPVSWLRDRRDYRPDETVHCCNDCNQLAGDYVPCSIEDKASYILEKVLRKSGKYLKPVQWTNEELAELDHSLKGFVKHEIFLQRLIRMRVDNLKLFISGFAPISIIMGRVNTKGRVVARKPWKEKTKVVLKLEERDFPASRHYVDPVEELMTPNVEVPKKIKKAPAKPVVVTPTPAQKPRLFHYRSYPNGRRKVRNITAPENEVQRWKAFQKMRLRKLEISKQKERAERLRAENASILENQLQTQQRSIVWDSGYTSELVQSHFSF
jgi:hypothetical protein